MQTQIWLMFVFGTMILFLQGEDCLRINDLMVPNVVENGSEEDVILDCDYEFEDSDVRGLVVKWFLNEGETPVYQWIPPKPPQDFGKLKGKLNLNYKATNEPNTMYRALQIRKPSPELSGEYKCIVSTFSHEASESKKMVIFVPQRDFRFWHTVDLFTDRERENTVEQLSTEPVSIINVTCMAEGVFPEPIIKILSASEPLAKPDIIRKLRNGLYDVTASYQILAESDEHTFECELTIPGTNYTVRKVLFVTPVESTTTYQSTTEDFLDSLFPDYYSTTTEYPTTSVDYDDLINDTTPGWESTSTEFYFSSPAPVESNLGTSWQQPHLLTVSSIFFIVWCLL